MQIDQVEWLRRENYFLREKNKKLKNLLKQSMINKAKRKKNLNN